MHFWYFCCYGQKYIILKLSVRLKFDKEFYLKLYYFDNERQNLLIYQSTGKKQQAHPAAM